MTAPATLTWADDDPARLQREFEAMAPAAPELSWDGARWTGTVPLWPFERPQPEGIVDFVAHRRLHLEVTYLESFPMVAPRFLPVDPAPELAARTMSMWHVMGDGSLCMFQNFTDWDPWCTAADLVPKASGWFIEFHLLRTGRIERMSESGIVSDHSFDHLMVVG